MSDGSGSGNYNAGVQQFGPKNSSKQGNQQLSWVDIWFWLYFDL